MTAPAKTLGALEGEVEMALAEVIEAQQGIWARFRAIGLALTEIRERALWPADRFETWDAYLKARFGFGRDRAGQIMRAAEAGVDFSVQLADLNQRALCEAETRNTLDAVKRAKLPEPTNERQLRALLQAPAEIRVKVWTASVRAAEAEAKRPSAAVIRQVTTAVMERNANPMRIALDAHTVEQERLERQILDAWQRLDVQRRTALYGRIGALGGKRDE